MELEKTPVPAREDGGMRTQNGFVLSDTLVAIWLMLWLVGLVGWCMNLYKLIHICCEVDLWLVLRVLGIVILPLGAIVGFL